MPYSIQPAIPSDAEAIASIFYLAWDKHPALREMWPATDPTARRAQYLARFKDLLSRGPELGNHLFKAVNEKGEILAFSRWLYPIPSPTPEKEEERWKQETAPRPGGHLPYTNVPLVEAFQHDLVIGRRTLIDPRETYFLHLLCVREDSRRSGLGRLLCEEVLKRADAEGREAFVEASPMAERLYESLGWERVRESVFQLGELGVEGGQECRLWSYTRKPRAT